MAPPLCRVCERHGPTRGSLHYTCTPVGRSCMCGTPQTADNFSRRFTVRPKADIECFRSSTMRLPRGNPFVIRTFKSHGNYQVPLDRERIAVRAEHYVVETVWNTAAGGRGDVGDVKPGTQAPTGQ